MCYLESWFPVYNGGILPVRLPQSRNGKIQNISIKSYGVIVDVWNDNPFKLHIIIKLFSNMSFRRHWMIIIGIMKKIFWHWSCVSVNLSLVLGCKHCGDGFWRNLEFWNKFGEEIKVLAQLVHLLILWCKASVSIPWGWVSSLVKTELDQVIS